MQMSKTDYNIGDIVAWDAGEDGSVGRVTLVYPKERVLAVEPTGLGYSDPAVNLCMEDVRLVLAAGR